MRTLSPAGALCGRGWLEPYDSTNCARTPITPERRTPWCAGPSLPPPPPPPLMRMPGPQMPRGHGVGEHRCRFAGARRAVQRAGNGGRCCHAVLSLGVLLCRKQPAARAIPCQKEVNRLAPLTSADDAAGGPSLNLLPGRGRAEEIQRPPDQAHAHLSVHPWSCVSQDTRTPEHSESTRCHIPQETG